MLPFYELILKLLREEGDDSQVRELADRIEAIHKTPGFCRGSNPPRVRFPPFHLPVRPLVNAL